MQILTLAQAAVRWAPPAPGSGHPARPVLLDAVLAAAEAGRYTGLLVGAPEDGGVISVGQAVLEYDNGACTDRWTTLRAEPGTVVWVATGPGTGRDPVHPQGTFPSIEAAMETLRDRSGRPLDWTQPYPDGIWRAGAAPQRPVAHVPVDRASRTGSPLSTVTAPARLPRPICPLPRAGKARGGRGALIAPPAPPARAGATAPAPQVSRR